MSDKHAFRRPAMSSSRLRKSFLVSFAVVASGALVFPAAWASPPPSPALAMAPAAPGKTDAKADAAAKERAAKLSAGSILMESAKVKGARVPEFTVTAVIDAPIASVWKVITDCGSYASVMPRVEAASVVKRKGPVVHCKVRVDLPFPLSHLDSITATRVTKPRADGVRTMSWTLVKGDYRRHEGQWTAVPYNADPARTLVTYRVLVEPKLAVPPAMLRKGQAKEIPAVISRIRAKLAPKPAKG